MPRRFGITVDCHHPPMLAAFWCELLGYIEEPPPAGYASWSDYDAAHGVSEAEAETGWNIVDPAGTAPRIYFQQVPEDKVVKNRLHLDIVASDNQQWSDVQAAAQTIAQRGARLIRESTDPADRFIVMADPEGNEFCLVP